MGSTSDNLFAAVDARGFNVVVALSRLEKPLRKLGEMPKGEFLRAVNVKSVSHTSFTVPAMHQLACESYTIFRRAQKRERSSFLNSSEILSISMEYRAVMRSCALSVEKSDPELNEVISSWELIWSLFEAIYMKSPDSSIVVDLLTWARMSLSRTPHLEELLECFRLNRPSLIDKKMFWEQMIYFLMSGMFATAVQFLDNYGRLMRDPSARELSRTLDELNIELLNNENTESDFLRYQREVRDLCELGRFGDGEARRVAMLISGDRPSLKGVAPLLDTWFQFVPGYLLFSQPCIKLHQLHSAVQDCMKLYERTGDAVEQIMEAAFSLDAIRAMHYIVGLSGDWWLAAHLTDILQKTDVRIVSAHGIDTRHHLVIEYANQLCQYKDLWPLAFTYLMECGSEGVGHLEVLVPSIPIDDVQTARKLCRICRQAGIPHAKLGIERTITFRCMRNGEWSSALAWAMQSQSVALIEQVVDNVLKQCTPMEIASMCALGELNEGILASRSLVFLHKYHQFCTLTASGAKCDAAQLLVDLITSEYAPNTFGTVLFRDLLMVLHSSREKEIALDAFGSQRVLEYLTTHDVCTEDKTTTTSEEDAEVMEMDDGSDEQLVASLRFALLQNLANTYLL